MSEYSFHFTTGRQSSNVDPSLQIMQQRLADVTADITRSRFTHRLGTGEPPVALEHREIVSQSPVSVVAPYHTALIVIAAASAFVISVLTVLVILYKRKVSTKSVTKILDKYIYTGWPH